jgi:hypothetical protein
MAKTEISHEGYPVTARSIGILQHSGSQQADPQEKHYGNENHVKSNRHRSFNQPQDIMIAAPYQEKYGNALENGSRQKNDGKEDPGRHGCNIL